MLGSLRTEAARTKKVELCRMSHLFYLPSMRVYISGGGRRYSYRAPAISLCFVHGADEASQEPGAKRLLVVQMRELMIGFESDRASRTLGTAEGKTGARSIAALQFANSRILRSRKYTQYVPSSSQTWVFRS